jgi:exopolysaccharide biosynthesis polyprenyl glycosylphosphotransferase
VTATSPAFEAVLDPAGYLHSVVDERTIEILERRGRSSVIRRRGWLVRRALVAADAIGLTTAFAVAELVLGMHRHSGHLDGGIEGLLFVATLPIWVVVAKVYGLYDRDEERTDHSTADDLSGVFHMVTVGAWIVAALSWVTGLVAPDAAKLVMFWLLAIVLVTILRATARGWCRQQIAYLQNTLIVGAGEVGQLVAHKLLKHPEYGINLVGFVDGSPKARRDDLDHLAVIGDEEELPSLIGLLDIERVIIAFSNESHEEVLAQIRALSHLDVQIDLVPRLFEVVGPGIGVHSVEGLPLLGLPPMRLSHSSKIIKRAMDLLLASVGLVVLSPLLAVIAVAIKLGSKGPILFQQVRMGSDERTFRILKFRSMAPDADSRKAEVSHLNDHLRPYGDVRMFKIANDPRVTRIGRILRRYSLDELPQLVNVLRGEMSLVGPRPLVLDEDRFVEEWGRRRLDLKPGMTGLWQVLGRSDIPFAEMVKLDYLYVTTWSLGSDIRLILRTLPLVLRRRGI